MFFFSKVKNSIFSGSIGFGHKRTSLHRVPAGGVIFSAQAQMHRMCMLKGDVLKKYQLNDGPILTTEHGGGVSYAVDPGSS